ncbi:hypothetical protein [Ectobacillus funiculus]|uniref:Transposase n=1 Tax=Ectobacillus funiculus TaxID=137993 RepID=A0ABV5WC73_9BACI
MLRKTNSKQISAFDQYYYDKIIPQNHLLKEIDATVDFIFAPEPFLENAYKTECC